MENFNAVLGTRLRAARRQRGWSLGEVESMTGGEFKASVVGAYERGERAISAQRLARLAEVYEFPPADLLPVSRPAPDLVVDLTALEGVDEQELVDRYLAAIHLMRRGGAEGEVRQSDKQMIVSLLETSLAGLRRGD